MKKIIFLAAFLMLALTSFSQDALYGIRAGYNISDLDFIDEENMPHHTHRNSFAFGFFGEYFFSEKVGLLAELQFSMEGSKQEYKQIEQLGGFKPESLRVDYLQMPILLRLTLGEKMSLGIGPQVGLRIYKYEDAYTNLAFSGVAGLEYRITDKFFVDARYHYGMTNIFDDNTGLKANNRNIQFGFGMKI